MSDCDTSYTSPAGSVKIDHLTKQILVVMNKLLALPAWGGEIENATCMQGSCRPYTSYSGATHTKCGVEDLSPYNWRNRFYWLDLLGQVPFHRTPSQGNWAEHVHSVTNGLGCVHYTAQGQIASAKDGRDGLRGNHVDPDKDRRSGLWPLAIFQGRIGKLEADVATRLFDGPASTRQVIEIAPIGYQVNALMEVRNRFGKVWFVTDRGLWGYAPKWSKV